MRKTCVTIFCSVFLCLFAVFFIPAMRVEADDDVTIQCGANVYGVLTSTGTLTISGSGEMWDCTGDYESYFNSVRNSIYKVVIGDDVTSVGAYAFFQCDAIQSVTLGAGVKSIGASAFYGCDGLFSINIPGNVQTIEDHAFYYSALKTCTLNKGLKTIGEYAFSCTNLTSIVIPEGVSSIESYAFHRNRSSDLLKNVTIPEDITVIKQDAFGDVGATIYSDTVTIVAYAFGSGSTFKADRGSSADTYASNYGISISYFQYSSTVKFDANGGSVSTSSKTVTSETYYGTLPGPARKGYDFAGWYTEKSGGAEITATTLVTTVKDSTLYAHWSKVSVEAASKPTVSGVNGGKMSVTIPSVSGATGYQIAYSLKSDMSSSSSKYTTKLSQNVSGLTGGKTYYVRVRAYKLDSAGSKVYGSWSSKAKVIIPSKVTFKGNGGTAGSSSIYVVTGKKYGTLPTATRTGYTFAGWYTAKSGGTRVKVSTKVTATANSTLYAHWTKVTVKKASKPSVTAKTSKSISVKITKVSGVKGYQIRYSLNKDMSSSKTKTVTTLKNTISGLKSGSKYYVQVRAYKLDSKGKKVYGSWSSKVSVKLS